MTLAIVLIVLIVVTVLFHFLSPWWFTDLASNWGAIDFTIDITFWVTGIVFVVVNLFVAYCIIRFQARKGNKADYEPENKKLEVWLTIITAVGVAAMLAPGLVVWAKFVNVPEGTPEVEVIGQQWHWSYRFPGEDGVFGTVDSAIISQTNPFGVNPDDPNGRDDVLVSHPELHLPVDQPIKVLLRSKDVLHDFAVPQFRVKMDLVPGLVSYLWLTPTRTGRFEILCEELCGIAHHTMRGSVIVEENDAFQTWLSGHPTYAQTLDRVPGNAAAGAPLYAVCAACHGAQAEGNPALNAPKLAGQQGSYMKRQLQYYKQGVRGAHEEDVFGQQMAPMAATLVDDAAINNVVAYIESLPDDPAPTTVSGDAARGGRLYATCAACHGAGGLGVWSLNAPRLSGISDWYLVSQLNNFKHGVRGSHAQDAHGEQMASMARNLVDENAINDIVAYINGL